MNSRGIDSINSVLILDDDEDSLEMLEELLEEKIQAEIVTTKLPRQALQLAEKNFFDMVLIDVTLPYNGHVHGGLEVYQTLVPRYGESSLIAYSQVIKDELLKQYDRCHFNFVDKSTNPLKFAKDITKRMNTLRKRQCCFVAVPFDDQYNEVYKIIKRCVNNATYRSVRIDEQNFTKSIAKKIFEEITNSKMVIFFATGHNPNVFYECGFADALGKEIITLVDHFENLPFDVRDRNSIAYGESLSRLESSLTSRLLNLTQAGLS